jgi:hypothetical protein
MSPRVVPQNNSCEEATPLFASADRGPIIIDVASGSSTTSSSPTSSPPIDVHYGAATTFNFFDFPNNNDNNDSSNSNNPASTSSTFRREAMMAIRQFSSKMSSIIEQHTGTYTHVYKFPSLFYDLHDARLYANHASCVVSSDTLLGICFSHIYSSFFSHIV